MIALGIDPGFASSPTGCALLQTEPLQTIETRDIRPRCGGDWQKRVDDVLAQLRDWLTIEVLPFYPSILLAYALPHLRTRTDDQPRPGHATRYDRKAGATVLNPQTALRLADLAGGFRGLAVALGLDVIGVQEAESKVALAGLSNATKQMMVDAARQVFGRELSEHEADACGHALAGEANWRRARLVREARGR
jgi:Holliday junction resolvasome RuvABC endonuclease subunit